MIAALVAFGVAIVTPMIKLTKSITSLDMSVKSLNAGLTDLKNDNASAHKRLWDKNDSQDERISDHETRISVLEHDRKE